MKASKGVIKQPYCLLYVLIHPQNHGACPMFYATQCKLPKTKIAVLNHNIVLPTQKQQNKPLPYAILIAPTGEPVGL